MEEQYALASELRQRIIESMEKSSGWKQTSNNLSLWKFLNAGSSTGSIFIGCNPLYDELTLILVAQSGYPELKEVAKEYNVKMIMNPDYGGIRDIFAEIPWSSIFESANSHLTKSAV